MKSKYLLSTLLILPVALWATGSNPTPVSTSALQFQQSSDTKVAVGDNVISFFTSATEQMTLTANGNFGIGTASPTNRLEVHASSFNRVSAIVDSNFQNGFQIKRTGTSYPTDWEIYNPISSTDLRFYNAGDRLTIQSNGNVGIGTNAPQYSLHLKSTAHPWMKIEKPSAAHESGFLFTTGATIDFCIYTDNASGGPLQIKAEGLSGENDVYPRVRIPKGDKNLYFGLSGGNVGIGTTTTTHTLTVDGDAYADNFITDAATYADFVFEDDYRLAPLSEVETFIEENNHLPDIPSEAEAKANGVNLQEMQTKLLQKIEELTLYVIEQNKRIDAQQKEILELKQSGNTP